MGSLLLRVATGALALFAGTLAEAADMTAFPEEPQLPQAVEPPPMSELGTGWYLRGDVTFAHDTTPRIAYDLVPLNNVTVPNSWAIGGGFGYRFTSFLRADWTFDYRNSVNYSGSAVVTNPTCLAAAVTNACLMAYKSTVTRWVSLLNGYVDLGTWSIVTPYVGAGVGISHSNTNGYVDYTNLATTALNVSLSGKSTNTFAWALMAGLAFDIAPHTQLDIGYRFVNMGAVRNVSPLGGVTTKDLYANELRIGVRFTPDL